MFFTKAGRIIAWIGTGMGFLSIVIGYEIDINQSASIFADMVGIDTTQKAALQGKLLRREGATVLFYSLVLGILTEISRSAASRSEG